MKNKELSQELANWFQKIRKESNPNLWNKDGVAKVIKSNLAAMGHFKKKPKGYLDF